MKSFNTATLDNGIKVITRNNPNTPRTSINLFMTTGTKYVDFAGTANLTSRLLLQGTATRSAEDLANELDFDGIEMNIESKQDYLRARTLFLNEDIDKAIEIFEDALKYSTFDNLNKEIRKLEGELKLDLDSPKTLAFDNLIKNIFPDHPYGYSHLKILEDLGKINSDTINDFYYKKSFSPDKIIISVVGDIEHDSIVKLLNQKFGFLEKICSDIPDRKISEIKENKIVTIAKEDSAQAQIIQGWLAPTIKDPDYAPLLLLNTILGAGGLSCRLFLELRDKKGLAYTVRSSYEPLKDSGIFTIYIGTAPNNIKECIDGFDAEINKLKNELVSEEELIGAKNNYLGKRAFFHETNSQQAYYLGFYETMEMGAEFDAEIAENIKNVTAEQIQAVANKYFSRNSIISVLAPQKHLEQIKS
jgi:predicted Zn-dependent peptidase